MNRLSQTRNVACVVINQNWHRNSGHMHKQSLGEVIATTQVPVMHIKQ